MRQLLAALALACAVPSALAQDAPIVGTWTGVIYQDNDPTPYPVTVTVDGQRGTTHYTGAVECRGELTGLRYPNGQLYGNMYQERITMNAYDLNARNPTGCYNGGTLSLTLAANGQLSFRWSIDWGNDLVRAGGELDPQRTRR